MHLLILPTFEMIKKLSNLSLVKEQSFVQKMGEKRLVKVECKLKFRDVAEKFRSEEIKFQCLSS